MVAVVLLRHDEFAVEFMSIKFNRRFDSLRASYAGYLESFAHGCKTYARFRQREVGSSGLPPTLGKGYEQALKSANTQKRSNPYGRHALPTVLLAAGFPLSLLR
jgi:hypothetical protein